ncbi:MAG: lipid-A-disaccharide synthase [Magnetococcales bacterium]|nr:lipid-A-disaccharide synthase [Magnetococcales bacterium]
MTLRLLLVAGEASGDWLGADLLEGLRRRFPDLQAQGVGGPRMAAQGQIQLCDGAPLAIIGLSEALRRLPRVLAIRRRLLAQLREQPPDLLITIDLPDFNFSLARVARRLGIPVVHYVSPQVWAWRRGRVRRIARLLDHLLVVLPFEPAIYAGTGLPVTFVGHPLVDRVRSRSDRATVRRELEVADAAPLVALLPGSRVGEWSRLLPIFLEAARLLEQRITGVRFVLARADSISDRQRQALWPPGDHGRILERQGRTWDLVAAADVALVASGTATLETALLGTPMVVAYRVGAFNYQVGKRLIDVPFIALPNLVAGRGLAPERIQHQATPGRLAADLEHLLNDAEAAAAMRVGFAEVKRQLLPPAGGAAAVVAELLQHRLP